MIRVYSARDITEAHIVRGMLESRGIEAIVEGEYLAGGIGELPVVDLISVSVDEADVEAALAVIREYDAAVAD